MARSGNLVARTIRLENPVAPVKYQGVVNSVKDNKTFGFIERSDVVREIFFHFNEVSEGENIDLGDDVEFTIQTRNGKEGKTYKIRMYIARQFYLTHRGGGNFQTLPGHSK